ncbi:MAG: hypothetical protein E7259_01840 [Lachnospiraceae bacterium]|nr:hypothetical protein [Lachnospiraceae bacterium]
MKKFFALCSIIVLSLFAVGCTKTIELSDEESKLIAEYAAELLIKYDRNINLKYDEANAGQIELDTEVATEEATTEEITTEEVADITTEEILPEIATPEDSQPEDDEPSVLPEDNSEVVTEDIDDEDVKDSSYDIGAFVGESNVSVQYMYYMVTDHYPSYDKDGMYIEIEAPTGYKLLVLKFKIENKTNEDQYIDLYSKDIEYKIILDNARSAKQMLTILMDDLYTYQDTVEASMYEEVVLLFQLSDSIAESMEDIKLKVDNGTDEVTIQLQ